MAGWFIATIGCTFWCEEILGNFFRRDLAPGASNKRFAIFHSEAPTARDYSGVSIDTNGLIANVTAEFRFADGNNVIGSLTGHSARFPKGIGHGNFSVDGDSGQWITVDLAEGQGNVADFFQWLVGATLDGNITAEELKQAVNILQLEAASS